MTILTRGADRLLELHAAELPQKDELCGCFWATLALRLHGEESVEQDDVALLAGSAITSHGHQHVLPLGQAGRNDFRVELPLTDDDDASGTSAHGVVRAVEEITGGRLVALPVPGPRRAGAARAAASRRRGHRAGRAGRERADGLVLGLAPDRGAARGLSRARRPGGGPARRLVGRPLRRPARPRRGQGGRARHGRRHVSGDRPGRRAPAARRGRGLGARGARRARHRRARRRAAGGGSRGRRRRAVGQRQPDPRRRGIRRARQLRAVRSPAGGNLSHALPQPRRCRPRPRRGVAEVRAPERRAGPRAAARRRRRRVRAGARARRRAGRLPRAQARHARAGRAGDGSHRERRHARHERRRRRRARHHGRRDRAHRGRREQRARTARAHLPRGARSDRRSRANDHRRRRRTRHRRLDARRGARPARPRAREADHRRARRPRSRCAASSAPFADEVVCLDTLRSFRSVGSAYDDFSQTRDEEVCDLLARAPRAPSEHGA